MDNNIFFSSKILIYSFFFINKVLNVCIFNNITLSHSKKTDENDTAGNKTRSKSDTIPTVSWSDDPICDYVVHDCRMHVI